MPLLRLLTLAEAAETLRVGRTTLHRLVSSGELAVVKVGGRRFIDERDLRQFVDNSRDEVAS